MEIKITFPGGKKVNAEFEGFGNKLFTKNVLIVLKCNFFFDKMKFFLYKFIKEVNI